MSTNNNTNKRASLIALLRDEHKNVAEANWILQQSGYPSLFETEAHGFAAPLTSADAIKVTAPIPSDKVLETVLPVMVRDAAHKKMLAAIEFGLSRKDYAADVRAMAELGYQVAKADWLIPAVTEAPGDTKATITTCAIMAASTSMLYRMTDMLHQALGEAWYEQYKALKNPGSTDATPETRLAAYMFAVTTLVSLRPSGLG